MRWKGSWLYRQMPLPFWRAMAGCIAIGSRATAAHWKKYLFPYKRQYSTQYEWNIEREQIYQYFWKGPVHTWSLTGNLPWVWKGLLVSIVFFPHAFPPCKSMGTSNCFITNIHKNIFFCVQQKKESEETDYRNLIFKIIIPLHSMSGFT